jgi:hypothetical protein
MNEVTLDQALDIVIQLPVEQQEMRSEFSANAKLRAGGGELRRTHMILWPCFERVNSSRSLRKK